MLNDFRFALRQARKNLLFSFICVVILALGIGANAAIFSVVYTAIFQPLPFREPDRLVSLHNKFPLQNVSSALLSDSDYLNLSEHKEIFSDVGAWFYADMARTGIDIPTQLVAIAATPSLFRTLGVKPMIGQIFQDDVENAALVSESYWRSNFGADPNVLHRSLQLNGQLYPIVGVMSRSFQIPDDGIQVWVPLRVTRQHSNYHGHRMYARLAPGLNLAQASALLDRLSYRMFLQDPADYPFEREGWRYFAQPLAHDDNGHDRTWLITLFGAVSCLLLIVMVNIAGLLAVRSTERQFDVSIRMALGASRFRIARQVFVEVMLLMAAGGVPAIFLAWFVRQILEKYSPLPVSANFQVAPLVLFGIGLCLLTGLVCAALPARSASQSEPSFRMKEAGTQRTASAAKNRLRQGFIIGQVAIATALLACGVLFLRGLIRVLETPTGFNAQHVLTMELSIPRNVYATPESRIHFWTSVLEKIRQIPGVDAASACTFLPFGWDYTDYSTFEMLGKPKPHTNPYANLNQVDSDFLSTLQIPLLRGRSFNGGDNASSENVALIDQTLSAHYFPGEDPIGQYITSTGFKTAKIIGVVGAIGNKSDTVGIERAPAIYLNVAQRKPIDLILMVRSALPQAELLTAIQKRVSKIDKDRPIYDVYPMQARIDLFFESRRFIINLILGFAVCGSFLASLGLYGLISYNILLRRREIGIRVALGATSQHVGSLVIRTGMTPVLFGIAIGGISGLMAERYFQGQMFAGTAFDGTAWGIVLTTVLLSCAAACALPAWRAIHFAPLMALRED